ncbi:esterase-like activity of phytase family protein [Ruegeria sp. HKCCSP351]|uniref:esterase-like activity of phytase family protein n=1 Tax=Ruegeria sp. HKCCSP351 TaxID=2794832 RepID=UPI001AE7D0D3|nr:esterase-like activity of phytase family protein [Ruegeria sp. HKCCSP351]
MPKASVLTKIKRNAIPIGLVLAALIGVLGLFLTFVPLPVSKVEELGVFVLDTSENERSGGFSGLEVQGNGLDFIALSDRAAFQHGRFQRQEGRIVGVSDRHLDRLVSDLGNYSSADSEGLALASDGRLFVSIEGSQGLNLFLPGHNDSAWVPAPKQVGQLSYNKGLESLAIDPDGKLIAIPERWPEEDGVVPLFRSSVGATEMVVTLIPLKGTDKNEAAVKTDWDIPFYMPVTPGFDPVGADFGPDGRLYVLERRYVWPLGVATQIRSFLYTETGLEDAQLLLRTPLGAYDNLEGISVWRDEAGDIRISVISDDNFNWFQETEIVEFRLRP